MQYAKIKQSTEAWELMNNIFTFQKEWGKHQETIEDFLGFPMNENIAFEISNLWVDPKAIRNHKPDWVKEFKKSDHDITSAKANSKVKKQWIELCERLGLETFKLRDFSWKYGLAFIGGAMKFHKMEDEYLIELDNDKYDFSTHDWAELIEESTFLRLRADYIDKQKSA